MPIDPSLSLQAQQPNVMNSLGQILQVAQGAQGLKNAQLANQQGQVALQQSQIGLQQDQQKNKEFQWWAQNNKSFLNPDGSVNIEKANQVIPAAMPTTGTQVLENLTTLDQAHSNMLRARNAMTSDMNNNVAGVDQALLTLGHTDKASVLSAYQAAAQRFQGTPIGEYYKAQSVPIAMMPDGADLSETLAAHARGILSPETQQSTFGPKANVVSTGNTFQQFNTGATPPTGAPSVTNAGTVAPVELNPAQQHEVTTGPTGNPVTINRTPRGEVTGVSNVPGGGGPTVIPPNESQSTLPEVQQIRTQANAAAAQAPALHNNAKNIIDLADKIPKGTAGSWWTDLSSKLGYSLGGDDATARQQLAHYMSLQSQAAAQAMGANTDHARDTAEAAGAGKETWDPAAIKSTAKVFDAYTTGLERFNGGLEKYLASPQNTAGPWGARQFKNAWSANFDPVAMQLVNAKNSGNKLEYQMLLNQAKKDPTLAAKVQALSALSKGQIPQ